MEETRISIENFLIDPFAEYPIRVMIYVKDKTGKDMFFYKDFDINVVFSEEGRKLKFRFDNDYKLLIHDKIDYDFNSFDSELERKIRSWINLNDQNFSKKLFCKIKKITDIYLNTPIYKKLKKIEILSAFNEIHKKNKDMAF